MTQEIYKRFRPRSLKKIVGNEETVNSLQNMLEKGTLPHTILFSGPSGCGKTTLARILKKKLNCHDMDWKELDCSAFRGIDTVREIMRNMKLAPTGGTCRIWLLDECHMFTREAQNATLKMLEDTPAHVYFFLCTTDPGRLIKAVRTRCCDMPVRLLRDEEIDSLTRSAARRATVELSDDSLHEIIDSSGGSARVALVLLDKIANLPEDQRSAAIQARAAEENEAIDLCRALIKKESWGKISKILRNLKGEPESVRWSVLGYANAVLTKDKNHQAYVVICAFESHFYDSKKAGLTRACYEATFGD